MHRHKMSKGKSRGSFRRGASNVHRKNSMPSSGSTYVMRGGIRL